MGWRDCLGSGARSFFGENTRGQRVDAGFLQGTAGDRCESGNSALVFITYRLSVFSKLCYTRLVVVVARCNWDEIAYTMLGDARGEDDGPFKLRIVAREPGDAALLIGERERA